MAEDNFKLFREKFYDPKKVMAIPPPVPPIGSLGGLLRAAAGPVARAALGKAKEVMEGSKDVAKEVKPRRSASPKGRGTRGQTGTFRDRVAAAAKRERTPREREKFGELVKREENLPAKQGTRAVTQYTQGSRAVAVRDAARRELAPYKQGNRSVAATGGNRSVATTGTRTFGGKGDRVVGPSRAVGAMNAAKATSVLTGSKGPNFSASTAAAETKGGVPPKSNKDAMERRGSQSAADFKAKMQGRKPGATASSAPKKAGDKSRAAGKGAVSKKLTNFERTKMRSYERGGDTRGPVTRVGARAKVMKERGHSFRDLFK